MGGFATEEKQGESAFARMHAACGRGASISRDRTLAHYGSTAKIEDGKGRHAG